MHKQTACCLSDLEPGGQGIVLNLKLQGSMRRRLQDIGLIENTFVECICAAPWGTPRAYRIRGAVIALRDEDCRLIRIQPVSELSAASCPAFISSIRN